MPAGKVTAITAPHVATIAWVAQAGANVAAGEAVARISVLDEEVELKADKAGRITSAEMQPGQLAEFGMTILQIAENP
jgi:biotin carboxyl carrier protein